MRSPSSELIHFIERGSGPPLLLIHGLMISGEMFEPVLEQLATAHRVIVPDLRGYGRSRGLPPPYTTAQLADDLSLLLDSLGIRSTSVLGYSHGGAVAQQLALDHAQQCERLVLACTYAFNMATLRERLEGHLVPLLVNALGMRRFAEFVGSQGLKRLEKKRADWVVRLIADQDKQLMVSAWREAMTFDSRGRLAEIRCPTLILAASHDEGIPIHHAKMLHDGIAGSQLVVIDGANHALIWTHPDEFVRLTETFLQA